MSLAFRLILMAIDKESIRKIRKRRCIPGWHNFKSLMAISDEGVELIGLSLTEHYCSLIIRMYRR
jgi:hypothetical protein